MSAPTLHEIAAMPFPASMLAMRKHYNSDWHKPEPDGGDARPWKVKISYSTRISETVSYSVEAASEDEAIAEAEKLFDNDPTIEFEDADIDDVVAKEAA